MKISFRALIEQLNQVYILPNLRSFISILKKKKIRLKGKRNYYINQKIIILIYQLQNNSGLPKYQEYFQYKQKISFDGDSNYEYIQKLFKKLYQTMIYPFDQQVGQNSEWEVRNSDDNFDDTKQQIFLEVWKMQISKNYHLKSIKSKLLSLHQQKYRQIQNYRTFISQYRFKIQRNLKIHTKIYIT
ncbi:unnamed protein product [Paramecium sonneborni]|uniref:Uncharacterized protein n=1 Tax=Paramecium sonneborni TaxID=65129 RepID=A0A8S1MUQ6_9CILI|nr:unnamed protein product [Paramecium sonneborni]